MPAWREHLGTGISGTTLILLSAEKVLVFSSEDGEGKNSSAPPHQEYRGCLCSDDAINCADSGRWQPKQRSKQERTMADAMITNQKAILANQKSILGNQKAILANQGAIQKNQKALVAILANQKEILKNQKAILDAVKK
jgi:hypothetical protein